MDQRLKSLTAREHEVFSQMGQGCAIEQIAKSIGLTEKSVNVHASRLRRKLGVASRTALVQLAERVHIETSNAGPAGSCQTITSVVDPAVWVNVFDAHPDPLMYVSSDYKVLRVNLTQATLLGLRASACEGRYCYELLHGSEKPPEDCPCASVVYEGMAKTCDIHFSAIGDHFRLTISPIKSADGRVRGLLHVAKCLNFNSRLDAAPRTAEGACSTENNAATHPEKANRHLFDRLLAFVLHHVGQHALDARHRAALLNNFVDLLSEFSLGHVSLWEASEEVPRAVFRHTFGQKSTPDAPPVLCPSSALLKSVKRFGFAKSSEGGVVRSLVQMSDMIAGASTYLMLVECAQNSIGCAYLRPEPMRFMCDVLGEIVRHATAADGSPSGKGLTPRELAVIRLLEGDYLCKTIADQLGVSLHTVHVHIRNIYRKLRVHTRTDAVRKWRTHRWNCCRAHSSAQAPAKKARPRL
jgi:DNA-binding NarL/FixJ family response regulator